MKPETNLINYIKEKYENLEMKNIGGRSNIERHTKPIMSEFVENAVAILIDDILKGKKYKYIIDAQLSIGAKNPLRPDIIIADKNNVIYGIVEVKAQLGYVGDSYSDKYKDRIKRIKNAAENGYLYIKNKEKNIKEKYIISESFKDFIVVLMSANSRKLLEDNNIFKGLDYFLLFSGKDGKNHLWYDNLTEYLNDDKEKENTYTKFVEYIESNFK